jgi:hypothetical protein
LRHSSQSAANGCSSEFQRKAERGLEEVDSFTLHKITKRMLWRVIQGQYVPLGLLLAYTIKLKLFMQNMKQESCKVPTGTRKCPLPSLMTSGASWKT